MFILGSDQKVTLALSFVDAAGNVADVDGLPIWNNSAPEFIDLAVGEDGLTAVATAVGPVGLAQITATADADRDEGEVRQIVAMLEIQVVPGEAVTAAILPGTPEPKVVA